MCKFLCNFLFFFAKGKQKISKQHPNGERWYRDGPVPLLVTDTNRCCSPSRSSILDYPTMSWCSSITIMDVNLTHWTMKRWIEWVDIFFYRCLGAFPSWLHRFKDFLYKVINPFSCFSSYRFGFLRHFHPELLMPNQLYRLDCWSERLPPKRGWWLLLSRRTGRTFSRKLILI